MGAHFSRRKKLRRKRLEDTVPGLQSPGAVEAQSRPSTPLFLRSHHAQNKPGKEPVNAIHSPLYLQQAIATRATHPVQQKNPNITRINRATQRRETRPVTTTRTDIEKEVAKSYWEAKVGELFELGYVNPVKARFKSNEEERDAVLSVLWQNRPGSKFRKSKTTLSSISPRTGVKGSKELVYQFTFKPATKKKKASVRIELIAEGGAAKVTAAPTPAAGYTPSSFGLTHMGFPENEMDAYFKANPEEHRQLYNWLENSAPAKFDQVITTAVTTTKRSKTTTRNASFKVKGSKSKHGMDGLIIHYLGALAPDSGTPGAAYHDKNYVDYELEKQQSKKKDKLGAITGLAALPADEISSVKYTIWQYFGFGKTRKSELDAIIPIANKKTSVYYTLRFDTKTNDVDVERIGDAGKGSAKPDEIDISRVQGFADNSKDAASLEAWLKKRYPAAAVTGKTLVELQASINKILKSDSDKADWFKKNYDIHILSASDGKTRMDSVHSWPLARRAGIKDYSSSDLMRLELSLQTMSLPVLARLKSLRMVRQDVFLKKKGKHYISEPNTYGLTLSEGSDNTVLMFDGFTRSETHLFAGGKRGVRSSAIEGIVHELGHVVGHQADIAGKFKDFVRKNSIKPVSWYGATSKAELFPEAFAFYQTDPQWVEHNHPKLFKWFETLRKTGKPP